MTIEADQSRFKAEDNPHEAVDNTKMYHNIQSEPAPISGHSEPDYVTATNVFINPASATASFEMHMYDYTNEIDREPTDMGGGGVYEEARVEWGGRGHFKESVKSTSGKQKKSAAKKVNTTLAKPEDLYAEPNKAKKKDAEKDSQVSRSQEAAAPSDLNLYAQPDMTKKMAWKGQQDVEQERKLPPQAPLSYKKHKEAKHESEEDGEDVPDLPPPYVPDEEQYYNTKGGRGPSSSEREYDYAVLDWQQK